MGALFEKQRTEGFHAEPSRSCKKGYDAVAGSHPTSPHARFDIVDWVPLDP